ncbi:SDR family NAD(P)-dependent oxidoreductase [Alteribacter aurantiacus]|uniref:SDR family NAD(P)-dependent oxidoreductase n=1 Tax=Alteribacter aurantiacus TaxID=254410 RepID=UPI0004020DF9|nr:SDR family oxidoreductase [Alteribacter aurantiacus]
MTFDQQGCKGKHILITGATGGIGWATALAAARSGASVTITGRNEDKLHELKKEIQKSSSQTRVFVHPSDLTNEEDRQHLLDYAIHECGPVTDLVNCAGIGGGDVIEHLREDDLRNIMELNFTSTVLFTQKVYKQMINQGSGAIVNVSSLSGLRGTYGNSAYSASKFALIGFTQSIAVEAIKHNVRVNAVCPGFVNTQMARNAITRKGKRSNRSYEEELEMVKQNLPSGRLTEPEEVANSILFLLSDAAENIVGESLKLSGGSVMR